MIGIIVAVSKNGVIGKNNDIPWSHKGDLKWFKETTTDQVVVMGRNTWESLPRKPLPGRVNIVLTSQEDYEAEGAHVHQSVESALLRALEYPSKNVWFIGGEKVYEEALPFTEVVLMTRVPDEVEVDDSTVFWTSAFDSEKWDSVQAEEHPYAEGCVVFRCARVLKN